MKRVVCIVQARMDSTRLPGKSLLELAGKPLVYRMLERLKRCKNIDDLVLAIPDTESNKVLKILADQVGVNVSLGPEDDLVERYHIASVQYNAEYIVRIPADNPVPEPSEVDKIIAFHIKYNISGFSSNLAEINNSGYPDGIGAEIFSIEKLNELKNKKLSSDEKEHIHLNFYNYEKKIVKNPNNCPVKTIKCPEKFSRPEIILDVNTYEQYLFMQSLFNYLYPRNPNFNILDILDWYDNFYKK